MTSGVNYGHRITAVKSHGVICSRMAGVQLPHTIHEPRSAIIMGHNTTAD